MSVIYRRRMGFFVLFEWAGVVVLTLTVLRSTYDKGPGNVAFESVFVAALFMGELCLLAVFLIDRSPCIVLDENFMTFRLAKWHKSVSIPLASIREVRKDQLGWNIISDAKPIRIPLDLENLDDLISRLAPDSATRNLESARVNYRATNRFPVLIALFGLLFITVLLFISPYTGRPYTIDSGRFLVLVMLIFEFFALEDFGVGKYPSCQLEGDLLTIKLAPLRAKREVRLSDIREVRQFGAGWDIIAGGKKITIPTNLENIADLVSRLTPPVGAEPDRFGSEARHELS